MIRSLIMLVILTSGTSPVFAAAGGILTVKTDPEGIEVWLDDQYIGDSPIMEKKLKAGRYSLKLVDAVQRSSTVEEVFIQDGETTIIDKKMEGKFGSIKIVTEPEGAEVSVLTDLGKTPVSNDFMNPGKYRLQIKHPNGSYTPVVQDVVIPKGQTITVTKALDKKNPFDMLALARLGLGAGAIIGYAWAIVEQGEFIRTGDQGAATQRTIGIILGTVCVVGFEIVAFF